MLACILLLYRHFCLLNGPIKMTSPTCQGPQHSVAPHRRRSGAMRDPVGGGAKPHMHPGPINTLWAQAVLSESSESQWANSMYTVKPCPVVRALRLLFRARGSRGRNRDGGEGGRWGRLHTSSPHPAPYCPFKESQRCGGVNNEPMNMSDLCSFFFWDMTSLLTFLINWKITEKICLWNWKYPSGTPELSIQTHTDDLFMNYQLFKSQNNH